MSGLLIRGGRIVDPATGRDEVADLRVEEGCIAAMGSFTAQKGEAVLDATGLVVTPGLVDLCVHLREPGFEELETIRSGARAALAGGFTSIAAMPDTDPPVDNEASVTFARLKGEEAEAARVHVVGALTKNRAGNMLAEMGGMQRAGAVAFSDEEDVVDASAVFLRAFRYARMLGCPVLTRCEDQGLRGRGIATNGLLSDVLGLPAIAAGTEELMVQRNLRFARVEKAPLHLLHLSTAESLTEVKAAREQGVGVTCSVTPVHLLFDETLIREYDSLYKFRPPLRSEADRHALVSGLREGLVDAISSDHSPRGAGEKSLEFMYAAPGTGALETTFAVLYTKLVLPGDLALGRLLELVSTRPAEILGIAGGRLEEGAPADVACFDLESTWTVDPSRFRSRSRVTPFAGWQVQGRARHVVVGGRVLLQDGEI